jgi:4-hydroxy-2-oxoheptanedioate aldolase
MRTNALQELWTAGHVAVNAWLTIPSGWTAELMSHCGFDSVLIDMQHGLIDFEMTVSMLQAISTTSTVPLVRVPWNEPGILMRVLDAGAFGIVCPMINTAEQARTFVGACRYPPAGFRSYGPVRGLLYGGDDYVQRANNTILTLALIETAEALKNLEGIASVEGLSGLYVGPSDLSMSLGIAKRADFDDPKMQEALRHILETAQRHQLIAGVQAGSVDNALRLAAMGFRLVTPMTDSALLQSASRSVAAQMRTIRDL